MVQVWQTAPVICGGHARGDGNAEVAGELLGQGLGGGAGRYQHVGDGDAGIAGLGAAGLGQLAGAADFEQGGGLAGGGGACEWVVWWRWLGVRGCLRSSGPVCGSRSCLCLRAFTRWAAYGLLSDEVSATRLVRFCVWKSV